MVRSLVWTVLIYGAEGWTLTKADQKRQESPELWIYRRMLRITCTEHRRGDWGPLGHFSYFVKYFDFEKQYACVTYHNLLTIHSAT